MCLYTHHQNVKLMMHAVDIPRFHGSYKHLLAEITCNAGTMDCFLGNCSDCSPVAELRQHILDEIEDEGIDEIYYKQWVTTDRSTLETMAADIESFCDRFSEKILQLKRHEFIADQQAKFLNHLKSELKHGEIIVLAISRKIMHVLFKIHHRGFTGQMTKQRCIHSSSTTRKTASFSI